MSDFNGSSVALCPENDAVFRMFFHANPLPMWIFDNESLRLLDVNEAATIRYGWTREEFLELTIEDIRPSEDLDRLRKYRLSAKDEPTPGPNQTFRWQHRTKAGEQIEVESTWLELPYAGRTGVLVMSMDRTAHSLAERRARDHAAMLELASDAIIIHDLDHRIIYWNRGAQRLYGWTSYEACGQKVDDLFRVEKGIFVDAYIALIARGEWSGDMKQRRRDGEEVCVESRWNLVRQDDGRPKSVLVINTDITEARRLEMQAHRTQRLEAIGTLASGIAHDLNNILSPILMAAGILRSECEDSPDALRMLNIIESSADRGAGIVKQVLTFARGADGQRSLLQPKHLVSELGKIMGQTFPRNIEIVIHFPPDLQTVQGDATQLHQVLLNLCVNARDAIMEMGPRANGEEPPRILTLAAENTEVDRHFASMNPGARLGPHIVLRVSDTGAGMAPDVMDRIFDPFFTTKEPGKGTGLGLATVIGIVKSHDGFLTVQSELGRGTTFKVFLPAAEGTEEKAARPVSAAALRGNGELVLVVDDEPPIREALVKTLEANNYRCYTAEDGSDALALYFTRQGEIDLVLTDLAMAQMDGVKLTRSLRRIDPRVRIVVSSGHIQRESAQELEALGVKVFIEKPYNAERLLLALRSALEDR